MDVSNRIEDVFLVAVLTLSCLKSIALFVCNLGKKTTVNYLCCMFTIITCLYVNEVFAILIFLGGVEKKITLTSVVG